jgi:hypothetical protein
LDITFIERGFSILEIAFGAVLAIYIGRSRRGSAFGLGASLVVMGTLIWVGTYPVVPGSAVFAGIIITSSSFIFSLYLLFDKNARLLALLGPIVIIVLATAGAISLTSTVFFVYAAVSLAFFDAIDYSRISITSCMKEADKYLKLLLEPLSTLEKAVRSLVQGSGTRGALSGSYFAFDLLALIVVPLVLVELSGGFLKLDYGIALLLLVWVVIREECYRGLNRLKK